MKIVSFLFIIVFGITVANAQTITVQSDKQLNKDLGKYKSFFWTSQVDNKLDPGLFFLNDLVLKAQVRQAVESELMGLGYKMTDTDPDMLVNFRVFEKPTKITGYSAMGPQYWSGTNVRDPESVQEYEVKAGTLMVHLVDKESGEVVWQGFASGLIDGDQFIKDEGKIKEAVNMIFEEYNQRATEYTRK